MASDCRCRRCDACGRKRHRSSERTAAVIIVAGAEEGDLGNERLGLLLDRLAGRRRFLDQRGKMQAQRGTEQDAHRGGKAAPLYRDVIHDRST